MDIIYIIRILVSRLPILIIISMSAAILAGTLTYFGQKKYRSTAQLSTGYTISNSYSLSEEKFSLVTADLKFNNLIEIMNSTILMGTLSNHLLLHDLTQENRFSNKYSKDNEPNWTLDLHGIPRDSLINILTDKISKFELLSSFNSTEKKIVKIINDYGFDSQNLRKSLSIGRTNYTDYLSIDFESPNPYYSAFLVNTLSEEFLRYNNLLRYSQSSESINFLSTLADQKKNTLEAKSNNLKTYKSNNQFLNFEIESESKIAQVKDAQEERDETLANINRINLSIESVDTKITDQSPQSTHSNKGFISLRKNLTDLIERRRNQTGNYRMLSDSIFLIRNQLDKLLPNSSPLNRTLLDQRDELNIELKVEEGKLSSINERLSRFKNQVSSFASTEATISFLQRDVDLAAQEYLEVQEKVNDARNANFNAKDVIRIIVRGQPAINHQSSGLVIKSVFSFVASLVTCIAVIILLEFIDPRIKTATRFQQTVSIRLLGTIEDQNKGKSAGLIKIFKRRTSEGSKLLSMGPLLRKVRYQITSQEGKVLLWTSLKPNEGKSLLMYSLAHSLGLMGKRVLIIDTNFRNTSFFKEISENEKNRLPFEENTLSSCPQNANSSPNTDPTLPFENYFCVLNENIHIIPNQNTEGTSPAEALAGWDFSKMLGNLIDNNIYDYIFLEGAALNNYADSRELSIFADRVILVCDAMTDFKQEDQQTLKLVDTFDGKLMGGILNRAITKV